MVTLGKIMNKMMFNVGLALLVSLLLPNFLYAKAIEEREDVKLFIDEMVKEDGFDASELKKYFSQIKFRQDIIDLMNKPAEKTKPWYEYKNIFLTDKRIKQGVNFWKENEGALAYAHKVFGVPEEIIVAIIGVETYYGRITGKHRVIDALFTLAFEYPARAKFFRSELKHYFRLCKEQKIDPLSLTGSYAGAMGLGQFMPSSYREYAVNFDGKDNIDIWNNRVDAIGSIANYFRRHGWKKGEPVITAVKAESTYQFNSTTDRENNLKPQLTLQEFLNKGIVSELSQSHPNEKAALIAHEEKSGYEYWLGLNNFYSITRYNHSSMYAMAVYLLSQKIKKQYKSQE